MFNFFNFRFVFFFYCSLRNYLLLKKLATVSAQNIPTDQQVEDTPGFSNQ